MRLALCFATLATLACAQQMPQPNYCFGFLDSHPERKEIPKEEAEAIQKAHIGHLEMLGNKRWLVGAGPLANGGTVRGILISKCESVQQAMDFASQDPAVKAKRLTVRQYAWYTPVTTIGDGYWERQKQGLPDKMSKHPVILLKDSGKSGQPSPELLSQHRDYILGQLASGKARAAGPLMNAGEWTGVLIYDSIPAEEALRIASEDPFVKAGWVTLVSYDWYVADGVLP